MVLKKKIYIHLAKRNKSLEVYSNIHKLRKTFTFRVKNTHYELFVLLYIHLLGMLTESPLSQWKLTTELVFK